MLVNFGYLTYKYGFASESVIKRNYVASEAEANRSFGLRIETTEGQQPSTTTVDFLSAEEFNITNSDSTNNSSDRKENNTKIATNENQTNAQTDGKRGNDVINTKPGSS